MLYASDVVDRPSALNFLLGRINYERTSNFPYRSNELKLDRMRRLLAGVGDPHLALKVVHIAGTKGKGSTAVMVSAIQQAAGRRVGLYTSPHLESLEERMVVDGVCCDEATFVGLVAEMQPIVAEMDALRTDELRRPGPTFFEITTAMAMLHFVRSGVDLAVLEVGLGGRLDSTNVCQPIVTAITSISFDHTKQLGNTLASIAREKAGIIKQGVPVISGVIEDEPRNVIRNIAAANAAPLTERQIDFGVARAASGLFDYWELRDQQQFSIAGLRTGMLGEHQVRNAAVAVALTNTLDRLGWASSETVIRQGLLAASCPARIESFGSPPSAIVDVAHNPESIEALVEVLESQFANRRRVLVFASSRDKDVAAMLKRLLPLFDEVVLTKYVNNPRAMQPAELLNLAEQVSAAEGRPSRQRQSPKFHIADEPLAAWRLAKSVAQADELICVTGSFFLAAELRAVVVAEVH